MLHGAPPTPPAPRRDPDRNPVPVPNAGQQQKAALSAQQASYGTLISHTGNSPGQLALYQHNYSAGNLDTLHLPAAVQQGNPRGAGAGQQLLRSSLDELNFRQQYGGASSPEQLQYGVAKQAWGTGGPAAPTGKLLPNADTSSLQVGCMTGRLRFSPT